MIENYSDFYADFRRRMAKLHRAMPDTMKEFGSLHAATMSRKGALDRKTKELIAVAIGISVRCDGCIASHVHAAFRAGATREEILDTIGVAVFMGGGPATVYGAEALQAVEELEQPATPG